MADLPRLNSAMPGFAVRDIEAALAYYVEKLGFRIAFRFQDSYAIVARDAVEIGLGVGRVDDCGHGACYVKLQGVDLLYREFQAGGVPMARELKDESYGMREFQVADPDGNKLNFGEALAD